MKPMTERAYKLWSWVNTPHPNRHPIHRGLMASALFATLLICTTTGAVVTPDAPQETPSQQESTPVQARASDTPSSLEGTPADVPISVSSPAPTPAPGPAPHAAVPVQTRHPRGDYGVRPDVQQFAQDIAQRHGWNAQATLRILSQAKYLPKVPQLIMPPPAGTAKNWADYRSRFIEPKRLKAGLQFWNAHEGLLRRAEALYGVPASLIVGIIGVETYYGRHLGGFRVLDALTTLSFDFPSGRSDRSAFFRGELEALLVWAHREGRSPQDIRGSYAGAIGWPQFMPSSILQYAVDFDGDGRVNLERNMADVIGSVAHFLTRHGWTPGLPTHFPVEPPVDPATRAELLASDIVPRFTPQDMTARGAVLADRALEHPGPLALVLLENGGGAPSFVAGTSNFYAVTRYNWSSYYALAVIELGREVQEARLKTGQATSAPKGSNATKAASSNKPSSLQMPKPTSGSPAR